jgi:TPP-dependent pyruvate/acetoin dehydrogenase alpha subunit
VTARSESYKGVDGVEGDLARELEAFKENVDGIEGSLDEAIKDDALRRFVHSSRGMELAPFLVVRALSSLRPRYCLYYRCHAWLLALGAEPAAIHRAVTHASPVSPMQPRLSDLPVDFISVTVGSQLPIALGLALGTNGPTVAVLGDGALSTGVVFETLNAAAIHRPDLLFVVEDNNRAVSTVGEKVTHASTGVLAQALGLEHLSIGADSTDRQGAIDWIRKTVGTVRILHVRSETVDSHCLATVPASRGAA